MNLHPHRCYRCPREPQQQYWARSLKHIFLASSVHFHDWNCPFQSSILDSGLGINPQIDGQIIRLPIPKLSEERREELTKLAAKYAENSKIVVRNLRRDFLDSQKDLKKNSELSEDDLKKITNEVQKLTDSSIEKIDEILKIKKDDILKV